MLVARSAAECRLYIELHPCSCGAADPSLRHWLRTSPEGGLVAVYEGACARCGLARRFDFDLDPAIPPAPPAYGGPQPSRIICPGQFALLADKAAASVKLVPAGLPPDRRAQARATLALALAAQEEVAKFIPPGADEVPAAAFHSPEGRVLYDREPGRFRRLRLEAVAAAYRDALSRYDSTP